MQDGGSARGEFGILEGWTLGLLGASLVLSLLAWIPGLICLSLSRFWTLREKLIAALIPVVVSALVALYVVGVSPAQNWIRIPMMLTVSGLIPALSAVYLSVGAHRVQRRVAAEA